MVKGPTKNIIFRAWYMAWNYGVQRVQINTLQDLTKMQVSRKCRIFCF